MVAAVAEEVAVEEGAATVVVEAAAAVAVEAAAAVVVRTSLACSPQSERRVSSALLPRTGSRRAAAALLRSNRMRV